MPRCKVVFYRVREGAAPAFDTLEELLRRGERRAFAKCRVRIDRLAEEGHDLRRPEAGYLRDGIHELRARDGRVHYRILYFFHGGIGVLSHVIRKEGRVPAKEIERAIGHRKEYESDPAGHTLS